MSSEGGKGSGKGWKGKGWQRAEVEQQEWGYLCALGGEPSVASAPAPSLGLKVVKRPRFCKQYSWFWSQPWKKALAKCSLAGEPRGDKFFQCSVPGCSGSRRTFQSGDRLSQHPALFRRCSSGLGRPSSSVATSYGSTLATNSPTCAGRSSTATPRNCSGFIPPQSRGQQHSGGVLTSRGLMAKRA